MWGAEYRYREELYEKNINKKAESRDLVFCFVCPACAYALGFKSRTVKVVVTAS
jgi:hypothetical protein